MSTTVNNSGDQNDSVIGISFGNTSSSISYVNKDGNVEVIANEDGDRVIPSALAYLDDDEYHGVQAKSQLIRNADNTVINFRDYIGKNFKEINQDSSKRSAKPHNKNEKIFYKLKTNAESSDPDSVPLDEVVIRHLRRLKNSASDFLGKDIKKAVISVPTDFTKHQRESIVELAKEAGLQIVQVINEPSAILLSYSTISDANLSKDKISLILDIGGTRTDGAIISLRSGISSILVNSHDYSVGGFQLDEVLVDYFVKEFQKTYPDVDPKKNPRALAKLYAEADSVKRTLSQSTSANISIDSLINGIDFHATINRLRYELIARKVLDKFVDFTEDLIKKSGFDIYDINEIILAGGVSNTPKLATRLANVFPPTTKIWAPTLEPKALHPHELITRGAAIQGSLLSGFQPEEIKQTLESEHLQSAPHTTKAIGLALSDNSFLPIILEHSSIPFKRSIIVSGPAAGGDVLIDIAEAESEIIVKKPEPKPKKEETKKDDEDDESDFSDEEEEEIKEKVTKPAKKIASLALYKVKPSSKIEIIGNIDSKCKLTIIAREVGSTISAKAEIPAPKITST